MAQSRRRFLIGASSSLAGLALGCRSPAGGSSAAPAASPALASASGAPSASSAPNAKPTSSATTAAVGDAWDPARAWLFFVGVIEFKDSKVWPSFPQAGRKDAELFAKLLSRGVPASQAVFIKDKDATRANLEASLAAHVAKAKPGDTLWVYYAGHGDRADDGAVGFAPYDAANDDASLWQVKSIFDTIDRAFPGARAFVTGDACHSGALVQEVAKRKSRVAYAALASSLSREVSTGSWTFTEALLAAFAGDAQLDADGDGAIHLDELAHYTEQEMAFVCGQLSTFGVSGGFPASLVVSRPTGKRDPKLGAYIEVKKDDAWHRAKVIGVKGNASRVRFVDEDDDDEGTEVLSPPLAQRAYVPVSYGVGADVEVEWEDKWYDAVVKDERLGVHFVHYVDDDASWDEWVGPARIRKKS